MREVFYGVISQGVAPYFFVIMEEKICSFFGHRQIERTEKLCELITTEITKAIDYGCRIFYFGGYGEFDSLCYQILSEIKQENRALGIERIYCVAQEKYLRKSVRYFNPEDYEKIIYLMPEFDGWYKSIYFRNCAMIDRSDYVIFYAEERESSGAYKAYKYAKRKKNKILINIFNQK